MGHRFTKHIAGTLVLYGEAPGNITVRTGSKTYRADEPIDPAFDDRMLDKDPWAVSEPAAAIYAAATAS